VANSYRKMRPLLRFIRHLSYVQGQWSGPRTREYFYYIDHQGQVSLLTWWECWPSWCSQGWCFTAFPWWCKGEELYNVF